MRASFLTSAILEETHTAADYLEWVRNLIGKVKAEPDGLKRIRLRIGLAKELMNEAFPIGLLSRRLFESSPHVHISLKIGNQSYDAVVCDQRSQSSTVQFIEVTMANEGEDDYLRMRALHEQGEVSGLGAVSRQGTQRTGLTISVEREMVSQPEVLRREKDRVSKSIDRKLRVAYPANTHLLIGFDDTMAFNRSDNIRNLEQVITDYAPRLRGFHSVSIVGLQKDLFIFRNCQDAI